MGSDRRLLLGLVFQVQTASRGRLGLERLLVCRVGYRATATGEGCLPRSSSGFAFSLESEAGLL
jgi:hypothetical protein